jgi:hypothetical protein
LGSPFLELLGDQVSGDEGARQQNALGFQVVAGEGVEQAFGDVFGGQEVNLEMQGCNRLGGGGADGADLGAQAAEVVRASVEALDEVVYAVDATGRSCDYTAPCSLDKTRSRRSRPGL